MKKLIREFIKNNISYIYSVFRPIAGPLIYMQTKKYKCSRKILYLLTPPANLSNVGDHAQAVAINEWLEDNFKDYKILEFDKNETYLGIGAIKKIIQRDDIIFLHSGGNLGDRGLWTENARRMVINCFPDNKIVSLPQTIYFSDTENGKNQLNITRKTYNQHSNLTIIARDNHSYNLAKLYFPKCKTMVCPDFVLYLNPNCPQLKFRKDVLLCLRKDSESIIDRNMKERIVQQIGDAGEVFNEYDTTLNKLIPRRNRKKELKDALSIFRSHKLVITDRFHGVIFSVITKTPCIVLKTIDHKLPESVGWFSELNYVVLEDDINRLSETINLARDITPVNTIDWRHQYFDQIKENISHDLKDECHEND